MISCSESSEGIRTDRHGRLIKCIDGVEYREGYSGYRGYLATRIKPEGSLYTCK